MSIRFQLLIVALTTLILPWAGCQYARDLETTLRLSQEMSQQAIATTIAHALSTEPQLVFQNVEDVQPFDADFGDFYVFTLHNQPLLDGYREDWDLAAEPSVLASASDLTAKIQAGFTERFLFLFFAVDDPKFDPEPSDVHPQHDHFDRVDLTFTWPDGARQSYFFATGAPGLIEAQTTVVSEDGIDHSAAEPRIQAYWLQTSHGYHLEARIPRSLLGTRLWMEARDAAANRSAGFMGAETARGGRMFFATPGLGELLATFIAPGTRATVIDANALILGSAGTVAAIRSDGPKTADGWYRRLVTGDTQHWPEQVTALDHLNGIAVKNALAGRTSAEWLHSGNPGQAVLSVAAPIMNGTSTRGAVVLEQAGAELLDSRDRALTHLFDTTLLATGLAVSVAFGVAAWVSWRIGRLRTAAGSAVGPDGHIRLSMPESASRDEIGALSRAFERLLFRLNEHSQYLRTLGGKLAHELRTPLTIVRSSLDNLESEQVRSDQQGYVTRARQGTQRLQSILSALGAASRVEESLKQAETSSFDLTALLESTAAGYRDGFRKARIELEVPADVCYLQGAPDLIVQMLDKLVENAVDFCPLKGTITIALSRDGTHYSLSVANDGPPIPPQMLGLLFESLFEHRQGVDEKPHFGLGLYIVRLIAEFHGGRATAANRPDRTGAIFTVSLPLI